MELAILDEPFHDNIIIIRNLLSISISSIFHIALGLGCHWISQPHELDVLNDARPHIRVLYAIEKHCRFNSKHFFGVLFISRCIQSMLYNLCLDHLNDFIEMILLLYRVNSLCWAVLLPYMLIRLGP